MRTLQGILGLAFGVVGTSVFVAMLIKSAAQRESTAFIMLGGEVLIVAAYALIEAAERK